MTSQIIKRGGVYIAADRREEKPAEIAHILSDTASLEKGANSVGWYKPIADFLAKVKSDFPYLIRRATPL